MVSWELTSFSMSALIKPVGVQGMRILARCNSEKNSPALQMVNQLALAGYMAGNSLSLMNSPQSKFGLIASAASMSATSEF